MEVELKSDWLVHHIELLKCLHRYEMKGVNDKIGSIDYVASGANQEKKLLRVIINPKAFTDEITKTINFLEKEEYDEAVILAEEFTTGAKNLIREKKSLNYISSEIECPYPLSELIYAIQKKTSELCKLRCGKAPMSESDCKGYQDSKYTCPIRRIRDDADFHAGRKWMPLLMNDFSRLVTLQREMNE